MNAVARRLLHAGTATVLLVGPLVSDHVMRAAVIALGLVVVIGDVIRVRVAGVHEALQRTVPVFRSAEEHGPSGARWLWAGYALAATLPPRAATAGILVAALADPAAATVGTWFGPRARKTWQGSSAAFVVACSCLIMLGWSWPIALSTGVVATVVERWSGPLDDNLLMPPLVALSVAVAA